jgi:molybdenum cofactor cytidylyltransferase
MGLPKQLLDVGGRSMLHAVVAPLASSSVDGIALVLHSDLAGKVDLTDLAGALVVLNDDEDSEMIDSIRIGLTAWLERATVRDEDGFLVFPADQPGITTADVDACIAAYRKMPDRIVVATRKGRRGHPIIFGAALAPVVRSGVCDRGLNQLPRAYPDRLELVACDSIGVTRDFDTPTDFDRLA